MATYLEIRSSLLADFPNESYTDDDCKAAVLASIRGYKQKRFFFNQALLTFATVAAQEWYSTDEISRVSTIDWARITISGFRYKVRMRSNQWIEDRQNGAITSDYVTTLAQARKQFRLYPIPQTSSLNIEYFAHYAFDALSADGDTNAWLTDGYDLIFNCSKVWLCVHKFRAPDMAALFAPLEEKALTALEAETAKRMQEVHREPEYTGIGSTGRANIYVDI